MYDKDTEYYQFLFPWQTLSPGKCEINFRIFLNTVFQRARGSFVLLRENLAICNMEKISILVFWKIIVSQQRHKQQSR